MQKILYYRKIVTKTLEELFTYAALYRTHLRGRRCKRDEKPLVRFEMTMLSHLNELHLEWRSGKYKVNKYHSFIVEESKRREIQVLPYANRIDDIKLVYEEQKIFYRLTVGLELL